ncbi:hypothetical protein JYT44_02735 [Caldithrix abyssi]|nr:hypothetical protein [Caldithrix abyssi]
MKIHFTFFSIICFILLNNFTIAGETPSWTISTYNDVLIQYEMDPNLVELKNDTLYFDNNGTKRSITTESITKISYNYYEGTNWRVGFKIAGGLGFFFAFTGSLAELGSPLFSLYVGTITGLGSGTIGSILGSLSKRSNTVSFDLSNKTTKEKREVVQKIWVIWKAGALKKGITL